jgi:hypothetical protein
MDQQFVHPAVQRIVPDARASSSFWIAVRRFVVRAIRRWSSAFAWRLMVSSRERPYSVTAPAMASSRQRLRVRNSSTWIGFEMKSRNYSLFLLSLVLSIPLFSFPNAFSLVVMHWQLQNGSADAG